jgi:thiol-disulfide isomerase/thioredoxin
MAENLLEFYGTECHFCHAMAPLVERLEKELEVKIKKIEVWHHEENAHKLQQLDKGVCGGVPFFYNTKTGKWLCGAVSYDKLKEWAVGK